VPDWVWVLLALLALIPFGTLLTILYQRLQAKAEEKRRLREGGSAAVTPVKDFLARIGPGSITWGTDQQNEAHLRESHEKWWGEVRPPLLVYANAHPSQSIRELAHEVTDAVQNDTGSTRHLLATRPRAQTMDAYNSAMRAHSDAHRLVEQLLQKIRDY
jgi:hypothetical protein